MSLDLEIAAPGPVRMSSLELVDFINLQEGRGSLTHANFLAKVPKVLGEGGLIQFQDTYVHPQNGRTYPCYQFPKREACLMAMSYSYELQAKVFDRMTELEAQAAKPVQAPVPKLLSPAVQVLADSLAAAEMLGVPLHLAQSEAVKETLRLTGRDFSNLLLLAPAQVDIRAEDEMLEPTELGRLAGMSAIKLNLALAAAGLQVKTLDGWALTEEASGLATRHHWTKGDKSGYNFKWKKSILKSVLKASV